MSYVVQGELVLLNQFIEHEIAETYEEYIVINFIINLYFFKTY